MKKTLLVLATLAATAGLAQAANVTLYGNVDTGLSYNHTKTKVDGNSKTTNGYGMESGMYGPSRFGLKGSEDLGNGYAVEFKLENGFHSDAGAFKTDGKLFDRESRVSLVTPYGTVSAGRMGALSSGAGTYDLFQAYGDVYDGGVSNLGAGFFAGTGRYDNMLTLVSPDFAGLKFYGQYSFATSGSESPHVRDVERYWGVGATYDNGPLALALVVDSVKNAKNVAFDNNDMYLVSFGGNYDFGGVKPFFAAQYGKHIASGMNLIDFNDVASDDTETTYSDLKGYALSLGSQFTLPCGTLSAGLYYSHTKGTLAYVDGDDNVERYTLDKSDNYGVGFVHAYPLSKRTVIYSGLGYNYSKAKGESDVTVKRYNTEVLFGLNHTF